MSRESVTTSSGVAGAVLFSTGLWLAWPPLAYLFLGSLLIAFSVFVHRLSVNQKRGE